MLTPAARAALRALFDCGAIRAPWNHPGYRDLRQRNLVTCRWISDEPDPVYRLTARGHNLAVETFR